MSIHIEGITVIVRQVALVDRGGNLEWFKRELGNKTFASDGSLVRGAFMSPTDAEDFVARLESIGLMYELNGQATDIAVADQIYGLAIPTSWLNLFQVKISGSELILCAKEHGCPSLDLVLPEGWKYESSLYTDLHFVPLDEETRIMPLIRSNGVDTVVDLASGAIVNRATPVDQAAARSARPPLSLAISKQEVFEREEKCIELLRLEARRGNIPMPENVVPKKRWWRPYPKRRAPYDRPDKKSIAGLARMYGQGYRIEIMADWIGILYGGAARLHYKGLAESLQEQQAVANRRWLERCPDGLLPTRRPISSDWLLSIEKELPLYDAAVRE